jgi:hypothetical protein
MDVLSAPAPAALMMLSAFWADSELKRGVRPVNASGVTPSLP